MLSDLAKPLKLVLLLIPATVCLFCRCRHLLCWAIIHPPFALHAASLLSPQPPQRKPAVCLAILFQEALQACWAAFQDTRRRPVVLLASFLQTMVLPAAFDCTSQQDARRDALPSYAI